MEGSDSRCLSGENIDAASERIKAFLTETSVDKRNVLRFRLMFEEILLNYRDRFGKEKEFTLVCTKRFFRPRVVITVAGESFEPFGSTEDGEGYFNETLRGMLANMGLAPSCRYKNGENIVTLTPEGKRRTSSALTLLAAVVLAAVMGGLCMLLPESTRGFLSVKVIEPLSETFMGLLSAISGPLIFLSVLCGIYSIGDVASFGKIGKRMITRFMLMSAVLLLVSCLAVIPFFSVELGGSGEADFTELYKMLLDIVPSNFFRPFTEGNPLQIIFTAVIFGTAMLVLSDRMSVVAKFAEQANSIVQFIMKCVSSFISVFVFTSIFNMIISGDLGAAAGSLKLVLLMLMGHLIIMAVYVAAISVRRHVPPLRLIKKLMPAFMIAVTTASSAAAFAVNTETCEKKLGISKKIINFGIPLGQVVFMPGAAVQFFCVGICMAESFGVTITPIWLATLFIIALVLSIAAPPVPGGALTCYTILIMQLGIPGEAIPIAIALNVILEFVATAVNLFCLQTELTELAGGLDMLDNEILRDRS